MTNHILLTEIDNGDHIAVLTNCKDDQDTRNKLVMVLEQHFTGEDILIDFDLVKEAVEKSTFGIYSEITVEYFSESLEKRMSRNILFQKAWIY